MTHANDGPCKPCEYEADLAGEDTPDEHVEIVCKKCGHVAAAMSWTTYQAIREGKLS